MAEMTSARHIRRRLAPFWMLLLAMLLGLPTAARSFDDRSAGGIATIPAAQLPQQARETLRLIHAGGPFPYAKDGVVFGNYERVLPRKPRGYYHEYTVPTPGVHDRGARRIITGRAGELYYTGDHYRTFKRILE
jgi:ribonuclease T1